MRTYQQIMASAVKSRVEKSIALGAKATWSAKDHREAVALCIIEIAPADLTAMVELLSKIDNHSGWTQKLEAQFLGTGHFMRGEAKTKSLEDVMKDLAAQAAG